MLLYPKSSEILVSSLTREDVCTRLETVTLDVDFLDSSTYREESHYFFNGKIGEHSFSISPFIKRADSFLPQIKGRIETAKSGTIIFITYQLFFSSICFLFFWSAVCLLMALYLIILKEQILFAALFISFGTFNYLFAVNTFSRKMRASQRLLHQLLTK
ncbi:hypothetical protein [Penaeicola halotolerans]|uniref:hypothetical protein n=1 Tax=Penaeicola halotolerans TaxID=2793196 RepID=UPI001CF8EB6F|nr:hypothetical protein [Penaeicola halotolerans]